MFYFLAASAGSAQRREDSPFHRSLNGAWDYRWVPKPADVPDVNVYGEFDGCRRKRVLVKIIGE